MENIYKFVGESNEFFKKGKNYSEHHKYSISSDTVGTLAELIPEDWEFVGTCYNDEVSMKVYSDFMKKQENDLYIKTDSVNKLKIPNFVEGDDFEKIYSSLLKMQKAKDKAYGNSALKPLDIFAKHHPYGSRLDEKLARVKNSKELRKNDVADIIGGLVLICKDKGWTNFEDLID